MTQRQIISCRLNLKQTHHPYIHSFETIACVFFYLSFFFHSLLCLPLRSIICDRQSQLYIFIKLKLFKKEREKAHYIYIYHAPCILHTVHYTRGNQKGKKTNKNTHKNDYNAYGTINVCEFKRLKAKFLCSFFVDRFFLLSSPYKYI